MENDLNLIGIKDVISKHLLQETVVEAFLFGVRSNNDFSGRPDCDIGIIAKGNIPKYKMQIIKDELEVKNICQRANLVDFSKVDSVYRNYFNSTKISII